MKPTLLPDFVVHVERERSVLRVVARTPEANPNLLIEAVFAGGSEGVWFRVTERGNVQEFSKDLVAKHPALSGVLRLIADEVDLGKPNGEILIGMLFRSLHIYVCRLAVAEPLPRWGRPIRHQRIEQALQLLNADISKRWTVELLAKAVGLSRPVFARRFLEQLGLSPMRYLTQRRMQIAAALLFASDAAISEVAYRVGYDSEFAFSRAFKRHYQVPPGEYRQRTPAASSVMLRLVA